MRKPSIEDKIRDRLQGHSVKIDNSKLFDSLGISEGKEKRRTFLWWFLSAFVFIFIGTSIYLYNNTEEDYEEIVQAEQASNENISESISNNIKDALVQENTLTSSNTVLEKSAIDSYSRKEKSAKTKYAKVNNTEEKYDGEYVVDKTNTHISKIKPWDDSNSSMIKQVSSDMELVHNSSVNAESFLENSTITNEHEVSSDIVNNNPVYSENLLSFDKKSIDNDRRVVNDNEINSLGFNSLIIKELYDFGRKPVTMKVLTDRKWAMYFYGGLSYAQQKLVAKPNFMDVGERYAEIRDKSEKILEQIQGGIQIRYSLNKRWSIGTGFQFTRVNTQHNYATSELSNGEAIDITSINIDINGDTTGVNRGLKEFEGILYSNYTHYNSLDQWEIPLSVWYNYPINRIQLIAGVQWNSAIVTRYKGTVIDEMGEFKKGDLLYNENRIRYSIEPTVGIAYRIDRRKSIHFNANYRYGISSLTNENQMIDHRINSIGVNVGYQWKF